MTYLDGLTPRKRRDTEVSVILAHVAEMYDVPLALLRSNTHEPWIKCPRHVAMWLCRTLTQMSLLEIGRAFGGSHHTTALYAVKRVAAELAKSGELRAVLAGAVETLNGMGVGRDFPQSSAYLPPVRSEVAA